jgi:hypothetical protein
MSCLTRTACFQVDDAARILPIIIRSMPKFVIRPSQGVASAQMDLIGIFAGRAIR